MRRKLWLVLPVLLLLLSGVTGLRDGLAEYREASTFGQRFATVTELAYGVVGWAALAALLAGSRWTATLLFVWAALVTGTGAVAAVAWGGQSLATGAVAAVAVAAVCGLAVWLALGGRRTEGSAGAVPPDSRGEEQ